MSDKIMAKIHGKGSAGVMALCDSELLGKDIKEGEMVFKVTRSFYEGDVMEPDTIMRIAVVMGSINAIGTESVNLLVENGLGRRSDVRTISGVPHIQIYNMPP